MTIKILEQLFINGTDLSYKNFMYNNECHIGGGGTQPSWKDVVISGIGSLTLVNAKANSLNYLKLFGGTEQAPETYIDSVTLDGKCEQDGTPTPTSPVDIVANNGAIKVGPNLFTTTGEAKDKFLNASGVEQDGAYENYQFSYTDYLPVLPNTTYTFSVRQVVNTTLLNHRIHEYTENKTWIKQGVNLLTQSGGTLGEVVSATFTTSATTKWLRINYVYNPTGENPQLEQGETATTYRPYGEIYYDGTVETATDSVGNVATAQPLLSVGNYKDTQEVLSGAVTRNVGIKVLDGTENWTASSSYAGSCYWTPQGATNIAISYVGLCTHFASTSVLSQYARGKYLQELNAINLWYGDNATTAVANLKQFLAEQYANGTPVIVVYALYTPTTETVSGQQLNKEPVTVSQASLSDLVVNAVSSSHTTPTPTQPLDIVANNGVIKYGQYGKNLFDGEIELGSINPADGSLVVNSSRTRSKNFIRVKPNTTYTFTREDTNGIRWIVGYNENKVGITDGNFSSQTSAITNLQASSTVTKTFTTTATTYYIKWYNTSNAGLNEKVQVELGDTATTYEPYHFGLRYDGTVETVEVTGKNVFDINNILLYGRAYTVEKSGNNIVATASSNTVFASRVDFFVPVSMFKENTTYYLSTKSDVTLTGIQCNIGKSTPQSSVGNAYYASIRTKENGGWSGAFTITDIAEGQEYVSFFYYLGAQNEGTVITISDIMISEGSTATTYEPYFNGGTATAQPLLKVGDYQDEQNITSGAVTRNVGIKVLDGSEGWASYQSGACWAASSFLKDKVSGNYRSFSTHYGWISSEPSNMQNNKFLLHGTQRLCIKDDRFTTAAAFRTYLADQYNAGTPVIIVYPLATATTETVTGQSLSIQQGTNVVEITQASIDNLELEVSYKAGVEVTVEEIEAVNNDESVEVTING